jgi:hypothetical protein
MVFFGCERTVRPTITRLESYDIDKALALHQKTYEPIYQFILGFHTFEGKTYPAANFKTRDEIIDFISKTTSLDMAKSVVSSFMDEKDMLITNLNVFFPTILHEGIIITDAYIQKTNIKYQSGIEENLIHLVIEETYEDIEKNKSLDYHRKTYYKQNSMGEWRFDYVSGVQVYGGESFTPKGLKTK